MMLSTSEKSSLFTKIDDGRGSKPTAVAESVMEVRFPSGRILKAER